MKHGTVKVWVCSIGWDMILGGDRIDYPTINDAIKILVGVDNGLDLRIIDLMANQLFDDQSTMLL